MHLQKVRNLKEKVAYIDGLARGYQVDQHTQEGQVLTHIIDVLEEVAETLREVGRQQAELEEYVNEIDDALWELENDFYGEGEEDYEVECPNCGHLVMITDDDPTVDLVCPECGQLIWDHTDDFAYDDTPEEFTEGIPPRKQEPTQAVDD